MAYNNKINIKKSQAVTSTMSKKRGKSTDRQLQLMRTVDNQKT